MIRRICILFTLCVSGLIAVNGQASIGGFLGINNGKLSGDAPLKAKYKRKIGINAGVYVDIPLGQGLDLSFQPSYSQEGSRLFYNVAGVSDPVDSIKIGLDYFSLPVLLKIQATNKRFYAVTGFETAFLLNSTTTIEGEKEDLMVKVSDINVAMHLGVGMNIPVGASKIFVELRYSQGLINLTDEPLQDHVVPRVKTSGTKIFVGYDISFKKTKK